jgi:hypothetical protein
VVEWFTGAMAPCIQGIFWGGTHKRRQQQSSEHRSSMLVERVHLTHILPTTSALSLPVSCLSRSSCLESSSSFPRRVVASRSPRSVTRSAPRWSFPSNVARWFRPGFAGHRFFPFFRS